MVAIRRWCLSAVRSTIATMRRLTFGIAAAVIGALGVPTLAAAAIIGSTHLSLGSSRVAPRANVVVSFRQPTLTGILPGERIFEALTVTGPLQSGCAGGDDVALRVAPASTLVTQSLRPAALSGHRWCEGSHRIALTIFQDSGCRVGVAHRVCPQYAIVPETVATASFTVTAH
jgi:hypothetical protein